jgi:hypothetical protein
MTLAIKRELAGSWRSVEIRVRVSIPWENSRAVMAGTTGAMKRATPATRVRKETMALCELKNWREFTT